MIRSYLPIVFGDVNDCLSLCSHRQSSRKNLWLLFLTWFRIYRMLYSSFFIYWCNTWEEVSSMAFSYVWLYDGSDSDGFCEKFQSWINLSFFNLLSHDPWFCSPVKFLQSSNCYNDGGGLDWVKLQKTKKNMSFFLSSWYNFICLFFWTAIINFDHKVT